MVILNKLVVFVVAVSSGPPGGGGGGGLLNDGSDTQHKRGTFFSLRVSSING